MSDQEEEENKEEEAEEAEVGGAVEISGGIGSLDLCYLHTHDLIEMLHCP